MIVIGLTGYSLAQISGAIHKQEMISKRMDIPPTSKNVFFPFLQKNNEGILSSFWLNSPAGKRLAEF
jgi:hypothetical protein